MEKLIDKQLLSIVLISNNSNNIVQESLQSIFKQSFQKFELIIIANNKNELDNLKQLTNICKKTKYIYNDKKNFPQAIKLGISLSSGDFITIVDTCSILDITKFEKQINYFKENNNTAVLGTFVDFKSNKIPYINEIQQISKYDEIKFWINFYNPIFLQSVMINNNLIKKHNITFNASLVYAYDYYFIQDIIWQNLKVEILPEILLKSCPDYNEEYTNAKFIQNRELARNEIQYGLLKRFFKNNDELLDIKHLLGNYPYKNYDKNCVIKALNILREKNKTLNLFDNNIINEVIEHPTRLL